jgi:hypothetical protein
VLFSVIEDEETVSEAAEQLFLEQIKNRKTQELLSWVQAVEVADLQRVLSKYMSVLFELTSADQPSATSCCLAVNSAKVDAICDEFSRLCGKTFTTIPDVDEHFELPSIKHHLLLSSDTESDDDDDDEEEEEE